ncbi:hypothetical protein HAPAU_20210 [Halalkalicoccus paucihalophilus]|uniref:Uncharacterized protein n=1 Tax=Halalkalicoccus paucihalophilus TaxID=1008153 RepID=A0A151ACC7_9EURY|nr:hypothetical protein [Halalkalicoccus paucihalophilus]KYH25351.1 hypothetical protein HAPAU_20210 [Halalkalicoccus paucihalophilus]
MTTIDGFRTESGKRRFAVNRAASQRSAWVHGPPCRESRRNGPTLTVRLNDRVRATPANENAPDNAVENASFALGITGDAIPGER